MLRNATFLATVTMFYLLAPVVSHADQGSGTAAAPTAATVQVATFSAGPQAGEPMLCHQESAKVAELLPAPHPVSICGACNVSTNCTKLCGDFAFCFFQFPHDPVGQCMLR
jgi:hypothetical protein